MKEYEFVVRFYNTYGSFSVDSDNTEDAYDMAWETICDALKDLPVEVEFDIDCISVL